MAWRGRLRVGGSLDKRSPPPPTLNQREVARSSVGASKKNMPDPTPPECEQ